jgi:hypothetical protein
VFVDELIRLASQDETEIIEAHDDSFDLLTAQHLHRYTVTIPANPIEKLILNVDLILGHHHLTSSFQERYNFMKDPLPIHRIVMPENLWIGFKPGPLALCIVAGISFDLPDRLIPFHPLQEKLNQLFITQTLHGLQLGFISPLHQTLDLFEESRSIIRPTFASTGIDFVPSPKPISTR